MNRIKKYRTQLQTFSRSPFVLAIIFVPVALAFWGVEILWGDTWPQGLRSLFIGIFVVTFVTVIITTTNRIRALIKIQTQLRTELADSQWQINKALRRLDAVKRINRVSIEASDEREVIELVLQLATQAAGALGASLVPLDEHCQPMAAITYGDQLSPQFDAWIEYRVCLSSRRDCIGQRYITGNPACRRAGWG